MDDVTDTVFRQIIASCAPPDLFFTEFVNVDGLMSAGRPKLLKKLKFNLTDRPIIAQLWGLKPENFRDVAAQIADHTIADELGLPKDINFAGIDLNMGCPAKSEVNNGACVALMKNQPLAHDIIQATQSGADNKMPISVKTRLGYNIIDYKWHEFLLNHKLNMLTIHGRTKTEMSKVPANWDAIEKIREIRDSLKLNTLIVGNGDVLTRGIGEELAIKHGLDGIMIGRGVFNDPYVFSSKSIWDHVAKNDRVALFERHVNLFCETWKDNERPLKTLNKFCKIYIQNFDGAKELREKLMAAQTTNELLALLAASKEVH